MKRQTGVKQSFLTSSIMAVCCVVPALVATMAPAQTFTTLRSFGALTNITGFNPHSQLEQGPDGTLYGTAANGGSYWGTVFRLNSDGSGFTVLKVFTNSIEGANPYAGVTLSGSVLYGTTEVGGSSDSGTVFKLNTNGMGYTVVKHFNGTDGSNPRSGLLLSGSVLYGTTSGGGSSTNGTVFKMNTDGSGYMVLKHFTGSDGAYPQSGLTLSGGVIYGTTAAGGSSSNGTVFKMNTDGTGYAVLKHFAGADGQGPSAGLLLSGSVLYGTTYGGGSSNYGTVFKLNTDGTGYAVLKHFTGSDGQYPPHAGLLLSGSTLYGTTDKGGSSNNGTMFKMNTDGTGYTVLKHFTGSDGSQPGGLAFSGSVLYGTTFFSGSSEYGTVFKLDLTGALTPIPLAAQKVGSAIILHWDNPAFMLQAAPQVTGTYTNIPGATSPYTNGISGPQMFFRLLGN